MTYPQQPESGQSYGQQGTYYPQGYGQTGQSGYGQAGYGQQGYSQPGYEQQGYGQQGYGQQGYAQPGYGQQGYPQGYGQQPYGQGYGQPGQGYGHPGYGYPVPKPAGQGLPANVGQILAACIGVVGILALFFGFAPAAEIGEFTSTVFDSFAGAYIAIAAAGVLALIALLPKLDAKVSPVVAALSIVGALVFIFQYANASYPLSWGAVTVLVLGIIAAALALVWLLVDAKVLKVAAAGPSATPTAVTAASTSAESSVQAIQALQPAAGYGDAHTTANTGAQQAVSYDPSAYARTQSPASSAATSSTPTSPSAGTHSAGSSAGAAEYPAGEFRAGEFTTSDSSTETSGTTTPDSGSSAH